MGKLNLVNTKIIALIVEVISFISEILVLIAKGALFLKITNIVVLSLFFIIIIWQTVLLLKRKPLTDELSIKNDNLACNTALLFVLCLMSIYLVISLILNIEIKLTNNIVMLLYFAILSVRDGAFVYLEKKV